MTCVRTQRDVHSFPTRRSSDLGFYHALRRVLNVDKDTIKGKAKDVAGRVQRQAGEWTGDEESQAEGAAKQVEGKVQNRSEEHTSELQSPAHLGCRLLLEKKKNT